MDDPKCILEALLFASPNPLPISKIRLALPELSPKEIERSLMQLKEEYQGRAVELVESGGGFLLRTKAGYTPYLQALLGERTERLSAGASEVLAIIAYRQPITRAAIEKLRGVDSSAACTTLLDRGLIEITGRLEAPGRPSLYGTTERFLTHYGLSSLDELSEIKP